MPPSSPPPRGAPHCAGRRWRCAVLAAAALWIAAAMCASASIFPGRPPPAAAAAALATGAAAPAAEAEAAAAAEDGGSGFNMVLDKTAEQKLGANASIYGDTLEIKEMETGGLFQQWSDIHPELAVKRGDVFEINGIIRSVLEWWTQNKTLELVVKRPGQAQSCPHGQLRAQQHVVGPDKGPSTCFLRIQRTGGSILRSMLTELCPDCMKSRLLMATSVARHVDWSFARKCHQIVTILRDPLDRILSEFFMLRTNRSQFDERVDWDIPASAQHSEEIWTALNRNFTEYLHIKRNPARNRQTLYLAGMGKQSRISKSPPKLQLSRYSVEVLKDGVDWDRDGQEILELAKLHLKDPVIAVGISEHSECSLRLFAKFLGWDADLALAMSKKLGKQLHQDKDRIPLKMLDGHAEASQVRGERRWTAVIDGWLRDEIERLQVADRELYRIGLRVFQSQAQEFGLECARPEGYVPPKSQSTLELGQRIRAKSRGRLPRISDIRTNPCQKEQLREEIQGKWCDAVQLNPHYGVTDFPDICPEKEMDLLTDDVLFQGDDTIPTVSPELTEKQLANVRIHLLQHSSAQTPEDNLTNWEALGALKSLSKFRAQDVFAFRETWSDADTELLRKLDPAAGAWTAGSLTTEGFRERLPGLRDFRRLVLEDSIAIVGGAHSLSGAGEGPDIDSHQIIVRINELVGGKLVREDTGVRTTIHVSNAKVAPVGDPNVAEFDLETDTAWRTYCGRMHTFGEFAGVTRRPFLIRPSAYCALSKYGANRWTRGFLFYWLIGRFFTKVDMYGFSGTGHFRNPEIVLERYLGFEHLFYRVNGLVLDDESATHV